MTIYNVLRNSLPFLMPFVCCGTGAPGSHFIESWDLNANGTVTLAELDEKPRRRVFTCSTQDENGSLDADRVCVCSTRRAPLTWPTTQVITPRADIGCRKV